jgi:RimJ/RimL family protein N-acetyltransferase
MLVPVAKSARQFGDGLANVSVMHPEATRLVFRDMTPDDIDDMAALLGDPDVMTYPQIVDGVTELEVGYHVMPALQRRGYATEAAAASRDFARSVLGATRLVAIIHPDNRPSQRVAENIGLRPEKRTTVHGGRDVIIYAAALD